MIRSSIDLGTNTCLLLVAEWDEKHRSIIRAIGDFSTIVRLGEGVDRDRQFSSEAMQRTLACLKEYAAHARRLGDDPVRTVCVATSQARDSKNSAAFFDQIRRET